MCERKPAGTHRRNYVQGSACAVRNRSMKTANTSGVRPSIKKENVQRKALTYRAQGLAIPGCLWRFQGGSCAKLSPASERVTSARTAHAPCARRAGSAGVSAREALAQAGASAQRLPGDPSFLRSRGTRFSVPVHSSGPSFGSALSDYSSQARRCRSNQEFQNALLLHSPSHSLDAYYIPTHIAFILRKMWS